MVVKCCCSRINLKYCSFKLSLYESLGINYANHISIRLQVSGVQCIFLFYFKYCQFSFVPCRTKRKMHLHTICICLQFENVKNKIRSFIVVFPCVFIMNSISQAKQHHVLAPIVINLRNNFSKQWGPFIAEHLSNVSIFSHFIPRCINCCLNGGGRRFIFFSSKNIFILSTFQ